MSDLDLFFHPRVIAVVGASDDPSRGAYHLFKKVQARAAADGSTVYGVNPRLTELEGAPVLPTLTDVPEPVDLAVLMVGKERLEPILRECGNLGIAFAIVFTAGFRETGLPADIEAEERLAAIAREAGVRLFGPNTNVNALETFPDHPGKKLALITQSGHQGRGIAQGAQLGIGIQAWVPTGNEADLEAADFIEHFVDDPEVAVLACYIEGFRSIPRLREAAEHAAQAGKPIVLVKIGRTEEGARMAASHTGHLTGADDVHDAFFRQYGMIRVDDLDELLETSAMFTRVGKPPGDGICVYAISGGTGTHMADLASAGGLRMPRLSDETQARLRELGIPDYLTVANPVDNGAQPIRQPGVNRALIEACLDDPSIDILVCPITGVLESMSRIVAADIVDAYASAKKPVFVIWGSPVVDDEGYRILIEGKVPMYRSFTACVKGIRRYLDYWSWQESFEPPAITSPHVPPEFAGLLNASGALSEHDSARIASHYGITFPPSTLCATPEEAAEAARAIGAPVVLKACGAEILHKSDLDLVRVGVDPADAAQVAGDLLARARAESHMGVQGVLVQAVAPEGVECIAGVTNDPQFGPVVVFGLGGVFVEVLGDVARRVAPLTPRDAAEMIRETKGFALLEGARGRARADVQALEALLLNVSRLAMDLREHVSELDLNPIRVHPEGGGVTALDALIIRA
jgi:acyl-CoA synthetase (NDP forming)